MRRVIGLFVLLLVGLLGAVASAAILYFFAGIAPHLVLLIAVPLLGGAALAVTLSRPVSRKFGFRARPAAIGAALIAMLPIGGLVAAILLSPAQAMAQAGPDPRGHHRTLASPSGAKIAWWELEPGATPRKTPVLFLHGGPGSTTFNRDMEIGQAFRDAGFKTIYHDQAGTGASASVPIAGYTLANAIKDIEALRTANGADKVLLWGQSYGASLAAAYAHAHPDRVAAIILDSPGDFPGEPHPLDYSKTDWDGGFQPGLRDATLFLLINNAPQLAEQWQSQDDARAVRRARARDSNYMFGYQCKGSPTKLKKPLSPGGGNLYPQLRMQDAVVNHPRIEGPLTNAPALLIRGSCDYLPPETAARYMKALPNAQRVDVAGQGHGFFGHDDVLKRILAEFARTRLSAIE